MLSHKKFIQNRKWITSVTFYVYKGEGSGSKLHTIRTN